MKEILKKYWWIILLSLVVTIGLPVLFERIIIHGPYRESFSNGEWFSFLGSYVGAIASAIIFVITICINRKDMQAEISRNQNNIKLNHEMKIARKVYDFFMLIGYNLENIDTELAEFRRFVSDIIVIRQYVLKECNDKKYKGSLGKAKEEFYNIIVTENIILNFDILALMNKTGDNEEQNVRIYSDFILNLTKQRNLYAEELTKKYELYIEQLLQNVY